MNWYLAALKKYAVFAGRARRKEYWTFFLLNFLFAFLLGLIGSILGITNDEGDPLITIYYLAMLVPTIAVGVRRMHDTGRSGWWLLLPLANLVFLLLDSHPGENRYGPNPKESAA